MIIVVVLVEVIMETETFLLIGLKLIMKFFYLVMVSNMAIRVTVIPVTYIVVVGLK